MDEKKSLIREYFAEGTRFSELSASFGISRNLGYKYLRRYLHEGESRLEERSQAPRHNWSKTSALFGKPFLQLRGRSARWGAVTIHDLL